jgi:hypothetical protein
MKGLPGPLPAGDRLLWQGRPAWRALAQRIFHVKVVAAYVGLLLGSCLVVGATNGTFGMAVDSTIRFGGLAIAAVLLLYGIAWGLARSTTYSLTSAHFVMEYGMALAKTVTIPYAKITNAAFREYADGTGDIVLTLDKSISAPYLLVWPHARPWNLGRAEPMLRAVPNAATAAQIIARALAASADMAPVVVNQAEARPARSVTAAAAA